MSAKLEPCPFCGSPFAEIRPYDAEPGRWWRVECASCCSKSQGAKYPAVAAASWNHRSTSSEVRRLREALEEARRYLDAVVANSGSSKRRENYAGAVRRIDAALSVEGEDEQATRSQGLATAPTDRLQEKESTK